MGKLLAMARTSLAALFPSATTLYLRDLFGLFAGCVLFLMALAFTVGVMVAPLVLALWVAL